MKRIRFKRGFTLAETLITLTILGVVAAITVPSLINKYIETSNRTKVKKAMTAYEKALNQMIIDNDVKGAVGTALDGSNCAITSPYFKAVEYAKKANSNDTNNCRFRTSDGVWWDIEHIENPIIALNEADLDNANAEKRFVLVGHLVDGILRINDVGFEANDPNKSYLTKLYNFINNVDETSGGGQGGGTTTTSFLDNCTKVTDEKYTCNGTPFVKRTGVVGQCVDFPSWADAAHKGIKSCAAEGTHDYWVPEEPITIAIYGTDAEDICFYEENGECIEGGKNYWKAASDYCDQRGTHLATAGELISLGYTNDYFWVSEAYNSDGGYMMYNGVINGYGSIDDRKAVCVGN